MLTASVGKSDKKGHGNSVTLARGSVSTHIDSIISNHRAKANNSQLNHTIGDGGSYSHLKQRQFSLE